MRRAVRFFGGFSILAVIAVLTAVLGVRNARAAESPSLERAMAVARLGQSFSNVAIAPDGLRVAWVEPLDGPKGEPTDKSAVWTVGLGPDGKPAGSPERVTAAGPAGGIESGPAFSPDGASIAFLSNAGHGDQVQIYVAPLGSPQAVAGRETSRAKGARGSRLALRKLTAFHGQLAELRFLPDGRAVTALAIEGRESKAGPLAAFERDAGVVGENPEVQRIARVDVATGAWSWASPADLYVYEYDAAPGGAEFVATGAHGEGDAMWWVAELWRIPADGSKAVSIHGSRLQIAMPRWSADGGSIAWIEGLMSDAGVIGGDVFVQPAAGGAARNLTPGRSSSPAWLAWTGPDRLLLFEHVGGEEQIATLAVGSGESTGEILWRGPIAVSTEGTFPSLALSRDGKTSAAVQSSFSHAPEVWAGPIGAWREVTKKNAAIAPLWGEAKDLHWTSDGLPIQGWLLPPATIDPGKRYPLVVIPHGGPSSNHRASWPTLSGILASQGFYVFLPNPRGSYGAGAAFQHANYQDFGYGDFRDILRGLDAALAAAPIDPERLGIFGWSYGGFMTMWAVTQTDRFKAAVAGAGIVNWQSYAGQNRIDQWLPPFFGATIDDDPWIYARSSPITFITHVKTPTLVLHGERDSEVPAPQGYEFWKALRRRGVPTQLVIYPDQGHHLNPEGELDRNRRIIEWFERWLALPAAVPGSTPAR